MCTPKVMVAPSYLFFCTLIELLQNLSKINETPINAINTFNTYLTYTILLKSNDSKSASRMPKGDQNSKKTAGFDLMMTRKKAMKLLRNM